MDGSHDAGMLLCPELGTLYERASIVENAVGLVLLLLSLAWDITAVIRAINSCTLFAKTKAEPGQEVGVEDGTGAGADISDDARATTDGNATSKDELGHSLVVRMERLVKALLTKAAALSGMSVGSLTVGITACCSAVLALAVPLGLRPLGGVICAAAVMGSIGFFFLQCYAGLAEQSDVSPGYRPLVKFLVIIFLTFLTDQIAIKHLVPLAVVPLGLHAYLHPACFSSCSRDLADIFFLTLSLLCVVSRIGNIAPHAPLLARHVSQGSPLELQLLLSGHRYGVYSASYRPAVGLIAAP